MRTSEEEDMRNARTNLTPGGRERLKGEREGCHPEEALYLTTSSHLFNVNKLLSLSLSVSLSLDWLCGWRLRVSLCDRGCLCAPVCAGNAGINAPVERVQKETYYGGKRDL